MISFFYLYSVIPHPVFAVLVDAQAGTLGKSLATKVTGPVILTMARGQMSVTKVKGYRSFHHSYNGQRTDVCNKGQRLQVISSFLQWPEDRCL